MKKAPLYILVVAQVFSQSLHAISTMPQRTKFNRPMVQKIDFKVPSEALSSLRVPLTVMAAAPQLIFHTNGVETDKCSSTVVSDDGKLLTASHCLKECLASANLLQEESGYWSIDTKRAQNVRCSMTVNGLKTDFKILAVAPCLQSGVEYSIGNYPEKCKSLDYAILQPEVNRIPDAPCLRLSNRTPKLDTAVYSIGYPERTIRKVFKKGSRDVKGKSQELTSGQVVVAQSRCFLDVDDDNASGSIVRRGDQDFPNPDRAKSIMSEVAKGRLIQTTADVIPGISGSSLVDEKTGVVYGIAMFAENNSDSAFCSGAGFYSSMTSIQTDLSESFPNLNLGRVLKCDKKAVFPKPFGKSREGSIPSAEDEDFDGVR